MLLFNRKAQSTAEYAILIGLVVGALVLIQTYVKRGIQGRFKDASDDFVTKMAGDANWQQISSSNPTASGQWEFDKLSAKRTRETLTGTQTEEKMEKGGIVTRETTQISSPAEGDYTEYGYDPPAQ